jgi:hypothetical protein
VRKNGQIDLDDLEAGIPIVIHHLMNGSLEAVRGGFRVFKLDLLGQVVSPEGRMHQK